MSKNYCKVDHKWCKFCKKTDEGFCCTFNKELFKSLKNIHKCPKREAKETISFRTLLKMVNVYDVMTAILKSHPTENKNNIIGYAKVYDYLLTRKGIKSNGMLRCKKQKYDDGVCINIYGIYEDRKEYCIEFVPWGEWITMNIEKETLQQFTKEEIVGAALWEMTFNGYTEERIEDSKQKLIDSINDIN